jgi:hypothetical protein
MDDIGRTPGGESLVDLRPAIDLVGLETVLTRAEPVAGKFHPHPDILGAYLVELLSGKVAVTFRRSVLEAHPEVKLLTYATSELTELLADVQSFEGTLFEVDGNEVWTLAQLEETFSSQSQ